MRRSPSAGCRVNRINLGEINRRNVRRLQFSRKPCGRKPRDELSRSQDSDTVPDCSIAEEPPMVAANKRIVAAPMRQRILDEAERLIAVKGVYGFTLQDVAAPLGVKVPAIYKHYRNRDGVLIEVSRRFIALLAGQFELRPELGAVAAFHVALDAFVELMMGHPAYVRLALVDFATPGGGMDYVKLAAGGSFKENLIRGPLAAMHARLKQLLQAGIRSAQFRPVDATDVYRLLKAALVIRLVFPDDTLLLRRPTSREIRDTKRWVWEIATRHLAPRRSTLPDSPRLRRSARSR
jgi:AcrR family transcriptional regulator